MSGNRDRDPQRLARELAETPCAVPVLVALQEQGGRAASEALGRACPAGVGDALRWLIAVRLIRRHDAQGTLDVDTPDAEYELTEIGASLTRSLTELAAVLASTRRSDTVSVGTGQPRQ
jgi:hypothetical protein